MAGIARLNFAGSGVDPMYRPKHKKNEIKHLYKAIAKMRSLNVHHSGEVQIQRVVEILERDYDVSVPDSLHKTIGRRIREFNAGQLPQRD